MLFSLFELAGVPCLLLIVTKYATQRCVLLSRTVPLTFNDRDSLWVDTGISLCCVSVFLIPTCLFYSIVITLH